MGSLCCSLSAIKSLIFYPKWVVSKSSSDPAEKACQVVSEMQGAVHPNVVLKLFCAAPTWADSSMLYGWSWKTSIIIFFFLFFLSPIRWLSRFTLTGHCSIHNNSTSLCFFFLCFAKLLNFVKRFHLYFRWQSEVSNNCEVQWKLFIGPIFAVIILQMKGWYGWCAYAFRLLNPETLLE